MGMSRASRGLRVLVFSSLLVPCAAHADVVRITSGQGQADWYGAGVSLEGEEGFRFGVGWGPVWGVVPAGPTPVRPDVETSLYAHGNGSGSGGYLSYLGEEFHATGSISPLPVPFAWATFGGSFRTPPVPAIGASAAVTAPFGFSGGFSFTPSWADSSISIDVHGGGIATIQLRAWVGIVPTDRAWVIDSIRYDFVTADPVPEPATMLLVGIGMAGVARKYRSRRADC